MSRTNDAQAEAGQSRVGRHPQELFVDGEIVGRAGKVPCSEWPERRCTQACEPYAAITGHPEAGPIGHKSPQAP